MWAVCQCTCPFKPCHNCAALLRPRNLPCRSFTYTIGGLTGGSGRLFSFRFPGSIPASFADVQPVVTQRAKAVFPRSEEHTSELQSRGRIVCRLLLEKTINKHIVIL